MEPLLRQRKTTQKFLVLPVTKVQHHIPSSSTYVSHNEVISEGLNQQLVVADIHAAPLSDLKADGDILLETTALPEITPSPVIGIIGKTKANLHSSSKEPAVHSLSCGCNDCFLSQFHALEQITVKSLSNLVDNFIKNKKKNHNGNPEHHISGCMCVDHLLLKRKTGSLNLTNFLRKLKSDHSPTQGLNIKPKSGALAPKVNSNPHKLSRNTVLTTGTPSQ